MQNFSNITNRLFQRSILNKNVIISNNNQAINNINPFLIAHRQVSRQTWNTTGNLGKRDSSTVWSNQHPYRFRLFFGGLVVAPMLFILYLYGTFDDLFHRKNVAPLAYNWQGARPMQSSNGYQGSMFEPAQIYQENNMQTKADQLLKQKEKEAMLQTRARKDLGK